MQRTPSNEHLTYLIEELRQAATSNLARTNDAADEAILGLCLGAALANDAADALEAILFERAPVLMRNLAFLKLTGRKSCIKPSAITYLRRKAYRG